MQNSTIKKLGALAALMVTTLSASAVTFECDGIFYNILSQEEKTAEVTSGPNYESDIVIPSVCQFDGQEFQVVSIGYLAFYGCSDLTSVTIPNSVTNIGDYAFFCCSSLTAVTIPNSVTNIGEGAFSGCSSLTNIHVESGNPNYCSLDGVIFSADKTELILVPEGRVGEYQIPDCVINIGDYAFYDCSGLTSVTIPNSVTNIGNYAFNGCSGLTSVTIPNSVTSIGDYAFNECSGLTSVTIPNSVTSIGKYAFAFCSSLTSVTIPNSLTIIEGHVFSYCESLTDVTVPHSVTSIKSDAFSYCKSLTDVTIPNSVTIIEDYAFSSCESLTNVIISNSVTSLGVEAFAFCSSLTNIHVESDNPNFYSSDGVLFNIDKTELITFPRGRIGEYQIPDFVTNIGDGAFNDCSNLTSVTIPNSVTNIGEYAFCGCSSLTSVTIPNSVANIGERAFFICQRLTSITIPNSILNIGNQAFSGCGNLSDIYVEWETPVAAHNNLFDDITKSNATLYIPRGCVDAYKAAEPWSRFAHIEEYDPEMSRIDAVEQAAAQPAWHVEGGRLHIDGETVSVMIFNAAGANIYNGPSDRIPTLPHGLYIAKIGNTTAKLSL